MAIGHAFMSIFHWFGRLCRACQSSVIGKTEASSLGSPLRKVGTLEAQTKASPPLGETGNPGASYWLCCTRGRDSSEKVFWSPYLLRLVCFLFALVSGAFHLVSGFSQREFVNCCWFSGFGEGGWRHRSWHLADITPFLLFIYNLLLSNYAVWPHTLFRRITF